MDVNYTPAKSVSELPITNIIHAPCPDMAGCENPDPELPQQSLKRWEQLLAQHGIKKRKKVEKRFPSRFYKSEKLDDFHKYGALGRLGR